MPNEIGRKQSGCGSGQKNSSNSSERSTNSSISGSRARKRKRCEIVKFDDSDLESELDCNLEDAIAIERKLRKVAKDNDLSDEEMRKLLQKFVKNEHILALVTLKAEDELARERQEAEQPAIIITDTPSVPKLTRAKARELNKTPSIALSSRTDSTEPEIVSLIKDDLHSDDEDEEYIFKEEDFISDDDPNTTISDMDSNPRTPQTPMSQTEAEDSPVKFTDDGCFKIPLEKSKTMREDLRIAARTRSKFCLQQTTIEDIESEFVPPDVEHLDIQDTDLTANDEDWMQFLNDFTKPLNSNFVTDDDDPINDPEYIAADKVPEDAEELRDINIPRKELTELVAELFEGLLTEGVSLESVELDTPQKFLQSNTERSSLSKVNESSVEKSETAARNLNFHSPDQQPGVSQLSGNDAAAYATNTTQNNYSFHPDVMSTPGPSHQNNTIQSSVQTIPVAYTNDQSSSICHTVPVPSDGLSAEPEWIAVKIPGQPNSYQLARVVASGSATSQSVVLQSPEKSILDEIVATQTKKTDQRYSVPYDNNFTWEYISIKKHVHTEYFARFESLRHLPCKQHTREEQPEVGTGFTKHQHDILQQQLRIHVQMLTQTFLQTYSHPNFWKIAPKTKEMIMELHEKAEENATYNAWNLKGAAQLITEWEDELSKDTAENREMMSFINKEVGMTNRNTRQVLRFAPRIMDTMLNSEVFMYPQYLPRIPFTSKSCFYQCFAPAEAQLIAMGLEKHLTRILQTGERISKKNSVLMLACERISKDTVYGKTKRRIWDHIKTLKKTEYYNPVKYFFEHNCAPPLEHNLLTFENNTVRPPRMCYYDLPLAWQSYLDKQNQAVQQEKTGTSPVAKVSKEARENYLEFVREALGEDIQLPESLTEAAAPDGSATDSFCGETSNTTVRYRRRHGRRTPSSVTINVNYVFGTTPPNAADQSIPGIAAAPTVITQTTSGLNTTSNLNSVSNFDYAPSQYSTPICAAPSPSSVVSFNYDCNTQTLQPIVQLHEQVDSLNETATAAPIPRKSTSIARKLFSRRYQLTRSYFKGCRAIRNIALRHRSKRKLQKHCANLLTSYLRSQEQQEQRFIRSPLVRHYYRSFKALELYTDLLIELKMTCRNAVGSSAHDALNTSIANSNMASSKSFPSGTQLLFGKRTRSQLTQQALEDEANVAARTKRASRQEENYRNMLLPDSIEDANRKDAIYAFNFYEKVEEAFKASNRPEDCKRFNYILKSFDPRRDKVADLYYKLENLFLPEHPELAQVFLTFLLPSEATEIGKFFEHFMVTNMTNFINKLNIYFNKQPAQIRKIYNCLGELAEDPDVTIKKIEAKILPLLKGNQFLIDWFLQQFPVGPSPDRLFAAAEHVNLKEVQTNANGEFFETVIDPQELPTASEQQLQQTNPQNCQLKYINGRIFYGNKITLPAKLSFMASNYLRDNNNDDESVDAEETAMECVHGIREHGEKRLEAAAANAAAAECNSDDNEKSEEDDISKALIIDTNGEDDSSSSIEPCDDATLRAHAVRLNPNYYSNTCFTAVTSTPTPITNQQSTPLPNTKKSALTLNEDGKVSPRKQVPSTPVCTAPISSSSLCSSPNTSMATANAAAALLQLREKRKSPTKKVKSPVGVTRARPISLQPMVVIHEQNSAIACAKKLKSLIEEENEYDVDDKERLTIVALAKYPTESIESNTDDAVMGDSSPPHATEQLMVTKVEHTDCSSDMEFLPEHTDISQTNFSPLKMDSNSIEEVNNQYSTRLQCRDLGATTSVDSDEDCKLDVVATLATSGNALADSANATGAGKTDNSASIQMGVKEKRNGRPQIAWTRHEDKLILVEMKLNAGLDRDSLYECILSKLPERSLPEIVSRHQFLMDFLSKLQGK